MPKATDTHTTPRRPLFRSATALLAEAFLLPAPQSTANAVAPSALPGPSGDDAELVRLCGQFDDLTLQIRAHYKGGHLYIEDDEERDQVLEPLRDQQDDLLTPLCASRATTLAGFLARARTLALCEPDCFMFGEDDNPDGYMEDRMVAALLRDMTAGVEG